MDEKGVYKNAFVAYNGFCKYVKMPFGLEKLQQHFKGRWA